MLREFSRKRLNANLMQYTHDDAAEFLCRCDPDEFYRDIHFDLMILGNDIKIRMDGISDDRIKCDIVDNCINDTGWCLKRDKCRRACLLICFYKSDLIHSDRRRRM